MQPNIGPLDRVVRAVLGGAILGLYGALPVPWRYLTLIGLLLIATALQSYCPLYRVYGVSTRRST
jgi:hypothetical protein